MSDYKDQPFEFLAHECEHQKDQLSQLREILRPAIESAREDLKSNRFTTSQNEVENIFRSLLCASEVLGVRYE